jgi:hypothetical protein
MSLPPVYSTTFLAAIMNDGDQVTVAPLDGFTYKITSLFALITNLSEGGSTIDSVSVVLGDPLYGPQIFKNSFPASTPVAEPILVEFINLFNGIVISSTLANATAFSVAFESTEGSQLNIAIGGYHFTGNAP